MSTTHTIKGSDIMLAVQDIMVAIEDCPGNVAASACVTAAVVILMGAVKHKPVKPLEPQQLERIVAAFSKSVADELGL